jgi:HSP20 family protein
MNVRDLVPWTRNSERGRNVPTSQDDPSSFFTLHREMNRLFDDVFRGFETPAQWPGRAWPHIEVEDADGEYRITAELPGMEATDVEVLVQDDILIVRGEKQAKSEDRSRAFSERVYGRFERRIALDGSSEANVQAEFRNGVLTVTVPKSDRSPDRVKRIAINHTSPAH